MAQFDLQNKNGDENRYVRTNSHKRTEMYIQRRRFLDKIEYSLLMKAVACIRCGISVPLVACFPL